MQIVYTRRFIRSRLVGIVVLQNGPPHRLRKVVPRVEDEGHPPVRPSDLNKTSPRSRPEVTRSRCTWSMARHRPAHGREGLASLAPAPTPDGGTRPVKHGVTACASPMQRNMQLPMLRRVTPSSRLNRDLSQVTCVQENARMYATLHIPDPAACQRWGS